jgi:hypothetical protein
MQEGLKELEILLDPYDWFYEVVAEARRYVVYVTYMDSTQDTAIPDFVQGKQVVCHFASAAPGAKNEYLSKPQLNTYHTLPLLVPDSSGSVVQDDLESCISQLKDVEVPNVATLCHALDKLEKEVGSNILQDIFYEIHDGSNAVTSLGSRYPDVQASMKRLYDEYGFDTIYNELDG